MPTDWLICRKRIPDADARLFCFHHLGGGASLFASWADALPFSIEVHAIQLPGREERLRESPICDFAELLEQVWGYRFGDTATVTVHIRRLRTKLEADPRHPAHLETVWGVGYRFRQ